MSEDKIATRLASANTEGVRQVVAWLENHSAAALESVVVEAFDAAERRGETIRKPWPYLDQVIIRRAQEAAEPEPRHRNVEAELWCDRLKDYRDKGVWLENIWGPTPGNTKSHVPPAIRAKFPDLFAKANAPPLPKRNKA